uniref:HHIP-like protein 2 isoform X1 n=1 Tax=Styela clava TaxID=7725 RepID=UPI001939B3CE|nr:HHIP-like protein 2 isoform X1 [Styela clava]
MMQSPASLILLIFAFIIGAESHPQCLDFKPPFKKNSCRPAAGSLEFCKEYENFGCCDANDDSQILTEYKSIFSNMTLVRFASCAIYLRSLLCQKCSPYAAHIYDAEDGPQAKTFPGLCKPYCTNLMKKCWFLVPMLTKKKRLLDLAKKEDSSEFCNTVKPVDIDYCYPQLTRDPKLFNGLGTENFYRQTNPFNEERTSCLKMCVEEVANGLNNPVSMKHANDGTQRWFVVEQVGIVWVYLPDKSRLSTPFLNLRDRVLVREYGYDERGMLDIAFHPNYKENGLFYLFYTILIKGYHNIKISEMKVSDTNMNKANLDTETTLLTVQEPAFNHNGGQLIFGVDGYLYIFTGDGGGGGDRFGKYGNGQNKKTMLGKVLRVDVNNKGPNDLPYAIPADNPFVNDKDYLPEIYALGVRNMWRCGMDRGNATGFNKGRIFCGDVGQSQYEEVDIIKKGGNYGWRAYEGFKCYDPNICNKNFVKNYIPPIHAYSHSVGKSITGGYVYRGCQNPNLEGKYIFGDFQYGKLFLLREGKNGKWRRQNICMGSDDVCKNGGIQNQFAKYILSFGEDEQGEIYMLSTHNPIPGLPGGRIYKFVDPSRRGDPSACKTPNPVETKVAEGTAAIPYKRQFN